MSTNPPETEEASEDAATPLSAYVERIAAAVGATSASQELDTAKLRVESSDWYGAVEAARAEGLTMFEFISAIDWANDVAVGDEPEDEVEERYEMLCALTDVDQRQTIILSTDLPKEGATIASVEPLFPGAQWHERESHEMFGIAFDGISSDANLYLPDEFEGYPLRKSFALLSREVKPWPGDVDVEDMPEKPAPTGPSTENPGA